MTEKLFYENPYLEEWESEVIDIVEDDDKFLVVLDKTAFYPEGGGQPSDKGYIEDIEVTYVFEENDIIYHVTTKKPLNKKVICKLEFARRFNYMQQHSGEHLISAVLYNLFNTTNDGFHMGEDYVTIDNTISNITDEIVFKIENTANQYIYENIPIVDYVIQNKELHKMNLRKECKVDKDIRIVEIENLDKIACCGIHVRNTGEIGLIKIIKTEKYKGMTRIYFRCGKKAFEDFQSKHSIVTDLTRHYSMLEDEIVDKAKSDSSEIKSLLKHIKDLKEILYQYTVEDILKNHHSKLIEVSFVDKNFEDVQIINRRILEKINTFNILISEKDNKVILSKSLDDNLHCGKLFKEHLSKYNGKGGGSKNQAQGAFEGREDMLGFISFIKEFIANHK